jgi:uncharacterized protein GlcG (DUF336 family)
MSVTLEDARRVIGAAERKAAEIGVPMNVAVVDAGGNLLAHERMDGAWLGSIDIAINKAFSSRAFDVPTRQLAQLGEVQGPAFGIHTSNHGRVVIFPGGVPLSSDGTIIGAVGASGGMPDQDEEVAKAGADAL